MATDFGGLCLQVPHPQNAFDLFGGEWAYDVPVEGTHTGRTQDFRVKHHAVCWAEQTFGSLRGLSCLELGPNEGEVSFHLHHAGCRDVLAIEARVRTFLKCLVVKNALRMDSVQYLLGDFVKHLEHTTSQYDLGMAAGVLYHMTNPLQVIDLLGRRAKRVVISTHYFTDRMLKLDSSADTTGLPPAHWEIRDPAGEDLTYGGMTARVFKYFYNATPENLATYSHGGPGTWAYLMRKDDILRALDHFGMRVVGGIDDHPTIPRGAYLSLAAERKF